MAKDSELLTSVSKTSTDRVFLAYTDRLQARQNEIPLRYGNRNVRPR